MSFSLKKDAWISVSEMLPAEEQQVLVCWVCGEDDGEPSMNLALRIGKEWYDVEGGTFEQPSHWMHLPEPPK